ncbi:MAG TPA: class I SAM-dependent methyltransferase [Dehalococcoidia bacterium]|nr:class I SAM-dependent methyltransferase [Dehalococcoidia bacterium]
MSLTRFIKDLLRKPEAIPTPGAIFYNATVSIVLRKPETKIANDIVAKMRSGTILDLGSGPGHLSIDIAKRSPGLQVYGIDLSRQMVKIARRHAKGVNNARFVFGNAAKLPSKDNSIDLVISTGALHHWKTPRLVFDECYRVLKAGGEAWIYDGCPEVFHNPADRKRLSEEYGFFVGRLGPRVSTLHGFTREEYQTVIKDTLEQTAFKGSYQMELTDIWMKITLKKR